MTYFERKERWKRLEAGGFGRFLLRYTLMCGGVSIAVSFLASLAFHWPWYPKEEVFVSLALGLMVSIMMWVTGKAKFR